MIYTVWRRGVIKHDDGLISFRLEKKINNWVWQEKDKSLGIHLRLGFPIPTGNGSHTGDFAGVIGLNVVYGRCLDSARAPFVEYWNRVVPFSARHTSNTVGPIGLASRTTQKGKKMCNSNARALFILSLLASIISEVCFIPVLSLVRPHLESEKKGLNDSFCWKWMSGPDDGKCPFLALFLATLLTGILLVCTSIHLIVGFCRPQCGQNRPFMKNLFRFGSFAVNLVVMLLAVAFVSLIIGFSFSSDSEDLRYTGYLLTGGDIHSHYHFILICIGTIAAIFATIFNGILAFRHRERAALDEFGDSIFQSFTDHSASAAYQEIN